MPVGPPPKAVTLARARRTIAAEYGTKGATSIEMADEMMPANDQSSPSTVINASSTAHISSAVK
jgi:hypothetical protein